jgi:hypothetical protein
MTAVSVHASVTHGWPRQARGGLCAIAGVVLGVGADILTHTAHPVVPHDRVSYPLSSATWAWFQVFFALTQALMAIGIATLVRSSLVAPGRARTVFAALAAAGMALTVAGELFLITAAGATNDSPAGVSASTVYGVIVLLTDAGLIGYGVPALRQRAQPRSLAVLPLVLGLFHLLVLTPVSLGQGFASGASQLVFAISYLLYAAIGYVLIRTSSTLVGRRTSRTAASSRP